MNTREIVTSSISLLWGFAEATFFFIVPDVYLTRIALEDRRKAVRACFHSLAGAILGGLLIFFTSIHHYWTIHGLIKELPGISPGLIQKVQDQISNIGAAALFIGPMQGTPYKIYAMEAFQGGVGLSTFVMISIPARLLRFLLTVGIVSLILRIPGLDAVSLPSKRLIHGGFWAVFYLFYFWIMQH